MSDEGHSNQGPVGGSSSRNEEAMMDKFNEGVANLFMAGEELRRVVMASASATTTETGGSGVVTVDDVMDWQQQLDRCLLPVLDMLARLVADNVGTAICGDMYQHCLEKCRDIARLALSRAVEQLREPSLEDSAENGGPSQQQQDDVAPDEVRSQGQAAVARITEINLLLLLQYSQVVAGPSSSAAANGRQSAAEAESDTTTSWRSIVDQYVQFQRQTLRQRARPAIAKVVSARRRQQQTASSGPNGVSRHLSEQQHLHAPAIADILGQAAALIHPLLMWRLSLPPPPPPPSGTEQRNESEEDTMVTAIRTLCHTSTRTLHEQANTLTKSISDWFWEDRPVDKWMTQQQQQQSAAGTMDGGLEQQSEEQTSTTFPINRQTLGLLDSLVEEMSFGCQVMARYQTLIVQGCHDILVQQNTAEPAGAGNTEVITKEILPEWAWKYATLERLWAVQQWSAALQLASPVQIVIDTNIRVPSIVEDAQYLSTRALERAATTQSNQAIGTVAHAVSHDVWSTDGHQHHDDSSIVGVFRAIVKDQRGCWGTAKDETAEKEQTTPSGSKEPNNAFASALADAFDEDLGPSATTPSTAVTKPPMSGNRVGGAPSSGNFLTALVSGNLAGGGDNRMDAMQLDAQFCVLNGIHAAAVACRSLVSFLDTILLPPEDSSGECPVTQDDGKATAMIQLAREELFRYAEEYQRALSHHVKETIVRWCGTGGLSQSADAGRVIGGRGLCLDDLRSFLDNENYSLDSRAFKAVEDDERLDCEFAGLLQNSRFLQQLSDKCEADVLRLAGEQLVAVLVSIVLESMWTATEKVTDWGSLLLSKQVRLLQNAIAAILSPSQESSVGAEAAPLHLIQLWERLLQVVTVLQLEKPSDWLVYQPTSVLAPEELQRTLSLRVDFSTDAIQSIVATVSGQAAQNGAD